MRALILHRSKRFMRGLRQRLAEIHPDVETTEWDTEQRGFPAPGFAWVTYDVMFCECGGGAANDVLARVLSLLPKVMRSCVVGVSVDRDVYAAIDAIHLGAGDVLIEDELESERLASVIDRILHPADDTQTVEISRIRNEAESVVLKADPINELLSKLSLYNPRLIGQGGMSKLYLAWSLPNSVPVVVKILRKQSSREEKRYKRMMLEGQITTALQSRHVVDILKCGECDDFAYLIMEFLPGGDLKERIETGLTPRQSVDITVQLCAALDALAAHGIVHRDIKPSNV
ncbi:MAG: protein kinase, partial [Gammaproteobacteria bacterium]|nr:protein kinase [Gammaproteobacteria bacterium]